MPDYRRAYVPGGTYFLTLVTHERRGLFADPENISLLRLAVAAGKEQNPFDILGAVVIPDHIHFLWSLPTQDHNFSKRVGQVKVAVTRSLRGTAAAVAGIPDSRRRRHESDVWQRRFWEHLIRNERDFRRHLDYIHYNSVKHGLASCPHLWPYSSFASWVRQKGYFEDWCCVCNGRKVAVPDFKDVEATVGE